MGQAHTSCALSGVWWQASGLGDVTRGSHALYNNWLADLFDMRIWAANRGFWRTASTSDADIPRKRRDTTQHKHYSIRTLFIVTHPIFLHGFPGKQHV